MSLQLRRYSNSLLPKKSKRSYIVINLSLLLTKWWRIHHQTITYPMEDLMDALRDSSQQSLLGLRSNRKKGHFNIRICMMNKESLVWLEDQLISISITLQCVEVLTLEQRQVEARLITYSMITARFSCIRLSMRTWKTYAPQETIKQMVKRAIIQQMGIILINQAVWWWEISQIHILLCIMETINLLKLLDLDKILKMLVKILISWMIMEAKSEGQALARGNSKIYRQLIHLLWTESNSERAIWIRLTTSF